MNASTSQEDTPLNEVLWVVRMLQSLRCRFWLEGGWGVDALVGRQTRAHRDVDIDVDAGCVEALLEVLTTAGYAVESDWLPNRVELVAAGRGRVDVHPLVLDDHGRARQAALDGGWHEFPPDFGTEGRLGDATVPCVSVEAQRLFRTGYEPRDVDRHDLAELDRLERSSGNCSR